MLRGVHDHQTVYKVTVTNNSVKQTTNVTLDDYLPAALEYLGCGGAGADHTTNAPTNLGKQGRVPRLGPDRSGRRWADARRQNSWKRSKRNRTRAAGDGKGVYTHLHWSLGTLEAGRDADVRIPRRGADPRKHAHLDRHEADAPPAATRPPTSTTTRARRRATASRS